MGGALRHLLDVDAATCSTLKHPPRNSKKAYCTQIMTSNRDEASRLQQYILTQDQTRYIIKERYLKELLDEKFGQDIDFKISVR